MRWSERMEYLEVELEVKFFDLHVFVGVVGLFFLCAGCAASENVVIGIDMQGVVHLIGMVGLVGMVYRK